MEQKTTPKRPAAGRKPRQPKKQNAVAYIAMHEVNVALCLAAGLLAPRYEENGAFDHHARRGFLVRELGGPSSESLKGARADFDFGDVLVVEVASRDTPDRAEPHFLPWTAVQRLVFPSDTSLQQFQARISAYGDVPEPAVPLKVEQRFFEETLEPNTNLPLASFRSREGSLRRIRDIDRVAGALATALAAGSRTPPASLLRALDGFGPGEQSRGVAEVILDLAHRIDGVPSIAYDDFFSMLAGYIAEGTTDAGFAASKAVSDIVARLEARGPLHNDITIAVTFFRDVIELRRDLPGNAFCDVDGTCLPRAVLLFLLNPEPDTLLALPMRVPNLGERVFRLAGMLVGLRASFSRLPKEFKANPILYRVVAPFAASILEGGEQALSFSERWMADGTRVCQLMLGPTTLASVQQSPSDLISQALEAVKQAGLSCAVDGSTGELGIETSTSPFALVRLAPISLATYPSLPAWRMSCTVPASKRDAVQMIGRLDSGASRHGISGKYIAGGVHKGLCLSAELLRPLEPDRIKSALRALSAAANEVTGLKPATAS